MTVWVAPRQAALHGQNLALPHAVGVAGFSLNPALARYVRRKLGLADAP